MSVAALIVAAGAGHRFGGEVPKVYINLSGAPVFIWALRAFDACPEVDRLVLAVSPEWLEHARAQCEQATLRLPVKIVPGGARRQDTVVTGLNALADDAPETVAVHDGARPLIGSETITHSINLARQVNACVTASPVTDTIKQTNVDGLITDTPDRSRLWQAQTPQTFNYELLRECYRQAEAEGWEVTDDASVVERCGYEVFINPGSATNLKITTPEDLQIAQMLLNPSTRSENMTLRIGQGYDVHALVEGRRLVLGGVEVPFERGLAGHSDADVLLHAIADALLGAVAAGDIGHLFPDTDDRWKGADSCELLRQVVAHIRSMGFEVNNVDATIIAQRPKLASFIPLMRERTAEALGVDVAQVSIKATTTEKLGFAGREEGIAAEAVVLVRS